MPSSGFLTRQQSEAEDWAPLLEIFQVDNFGSGKSKFKIFERSDYATGLE